jgi:hypothetical protein
MVSAHEVENGDVKTIELRVAPDDVGKVIGKEGRTIKALRTVLHAASIKSQKRVQLEIIEE